MGRWSTRTGKLATERGNLIKAMYRAAPAPIACSS